MSHDVMLTVATNVRRLMAHRGWSQPTLSQRAGVGQTTLSSLLRYGDGSDKVATLSTVAAVAKAFGVEPWMLQVHDMPIEVMLDKRVERVIDSYIEAGQEGRDSICRVAESEARYQAFRSGQQKAG
jgi:transcriptional regulator with XRE-family HTH domain